MRPPFSGHNPNFVVDLSAIPLGTEIATVSMLDLLQSAAK
jgi:hippurate hydrolase